MKCIPVDASLFEVGIIGVEQIPHLLKNLDRIGTVFLCLRVRELDISRTSVVVYCQTMPHAK
jgi:hypothetical protein